MSKPEGTYRGPGGRSAPERIDTGGSPCASPGCSSMHRSSSWRWSRRCSSWWRRLEGRARACPPAAPAPGCGGGASTGRRRRRRRTAPSRRSITDGGATGGTAGARLVAPPAAAGPAAAHRAVRRRHEPLQGRQAGRRPPDRPRRASPRSPATTAAPPTRASPTRRSRSSTSPRSPTSRSTPSSRTQGLAVTEEDFMDAVNQYVKFINEHYELYGRKIVIKRIVGDCPTTPPDYDKCIAAAQQVVKEKPFARHLGHLAVRHRLRRLGPCRDRQPRRLHLRRQLLQPRRPYRYDVGMDGTQSADHIAEYYCKKLAGKPADHAGIDHPPDHRRARAPSATSAIIVPEIEANVLTAKRVRQQGRRRATAATRSRCCAPTSPTSRPRRSRRRRRCRRSSPARSRRSSACATRSRRSSSPRA